jgi:hypothetical protein
MSITFQESRVVWVPVFRNWMQTQGLVHQSWEQVLLLVLVLV